MPHCILDYSSNHVDELDIRMLFHDLHTCLMKAWNFKIGDFKSRATVHDEYWIGDGAVENVFVALVLHVMSGKKESEKKTICAAAMEVLQKHFQRSLSSQVTSLSVQVVDVDRSCYFRINS